ncbi:hypothetical protein GDO81_006172 [Engystomops pustulosus]|uniref:Uncharacterized protein n=2 Tax=Engystomops pustulosus TaxID=76066 RepID=A0AAV7CVG3_ENGPU|nr:hypothetical protein GDO81_006172 [Engystomops pustulosus]
MHTTVTSQRPLRFSEAGSEHPDSPVFLPDPVFFPPPRLNRNTNNSKIPSEHEHNLIPLNTIKAQVKESSGIP